MNYGELISVVIPTYNRGRKIMRALASVRAQTYPKLEIVVVDDGSTDGTDALLATIDDPRVRVVRHPRNRGAAAARNSGVRAARGNWIAFQDSDDDWMCEKLTRQAARMAELPEDYVALFCTKIDYGHDGRNRFGSRLARCMPDPDEKIESGDLHARLLRGNIIGPQTTLISRSAFQEAGGFDERLRNNEDWDFFIRLSERGKIAFLDDPLVVVMISEDSISRNRGFSTSSFVRIFGKIRRRSQDRKLLAAHACIVGGKLNRAGRKKFARRYFRKALKWQPLRPRTCLKYLYSYLPLRFTARAGAQAGTRSASAMTDQSPGRPPRPAPTVQPQHRVPPDRGSRAATVPLRAGADVRQATDMAGQVALTGQRT